MKNLRAPLSIRIGLKFEIWKNPISAAEFAGEDRRSLPQRCNTGHAYVIFLSVLHQLCMVFGEAGTIGCQNLCRHVAVYFCL